MVISGRLFSNLEPQGDRLIHRPGSWLGSTALVAGTTVGAGVLALPAATQAAGVVPSSLMLMGLWIYTVLAGWLIAEINLTVWRRTGQPGLGLIAMVAEVAGPGWAKVVSVAYLFLHYALLVAYVTEGGQVLTAGFSALLGWGAGTAVTIPAWVGIGVFTLSLGGLIYWGSQHWVEWVNNVLVLVLLVAFLGLVGVGLAHVDLGRGLVQNWSALRPAVPVMLVALFYHNLVPVVVTQLEGDGQRIRLALGVGSAIPLGMFLLWNGLILVGLAPEQGIDPLAPLLGLEVGAFGRWVLGLVGVFSGAAIATSFIGVSLALYQVFQELRGWGWLPVSLQSAPWALYSWVWLPPVGFSSLNPNLFFVALDYAGTFSITVLYGLLPAVMVWYQRRYWSALVHPPLLPGGNGMLVAMIGVAIAILVSAGWR
jgi:tyrosine-specific transport protein